MKLLLAVFLNAGLLALLVPWLRRQWQWAAAGRWRALLVAGLGLRVLVGLTRNWTLKLDAQFLSDISHRVTTQLWRDPVAAWHTLTGPVAVFHVVDSFQTYDAAFQSLSNTWFLIRILTFLNLASLEVGWLNGLYLSVFAFIGCWYLVRALADIFPAAPAAAAAVAFLLWPTVWFWASGISKEAVLLGSGAWLVAKVLGRLYAPNAHAPGWPWQWWLGTAALAYLHFNMRYFFAGPLLAALVGIALGRWLQVRGVGRHRWASVAALALVLSVGAWVAPQMSVAFRVNKFTNQVIRVYTHELSRSVGKPHFEYPDLRPTLESIAAHAPRAAANTLTRPWVGESWQPLYVAAALENAAMLALLAVAIAALVRGKGGHLPFELALGLVIFCLILAMLMGLTTPNLGSLNRYRSGLLPFFLLLVLQNDYAAAGLRRLGLRARPPAANLPRPQSPARPLA